MRTNLQFGAKYRVIVALDPFVKSVISDEMIATELGRWQLFGQVTNTDTGYLIEAEFRGRTGTYTLPNAVETCEIMG